MRSEKSFYCQKHDPSLMCNTWGSKAQTGLSTNQANSFILNAWNPTRRVISPLSERKIGSVQSCRKEKEFVKKLRSSTIENRWTFSTRKRRSIYTESAYGSGSGIAWQVEFLEWCNGILWSWNLDYPTLECSAAVLACSLTHGTHMVHWETFLKTFLHRMNRQQLVFEIQEVLQIHSANPCPWIQGELTTLTPRFSAKCMVEQRRNQVSEMHFDKFPNLSTSQCWKTSFQTQVCSCSGYPSEATRWVKEVEVANSVDDLKTSHSIRGHRFPKFEVLDAKIASSLKKIIQKTNFKKRVNLAEQKAPGRQIAYVAGNRHSWGIFGVIRSIQHFFSWRCRSRMPHEMGRSIAVNQRGTLRRYPGKFV